MDKILTVEQIAEVLQVKAMTVREMLRDKRIRGFKVGKAWRTTEKMLEEDIQAIARGEDPADLPMPGTQKAARDVAVPKRGRKQPAQAKPAAKQAPKKKAKAAPKKNATEDDDTQQLLF